MAKSGHNAKAIYSPCKILSLGQKKKLPKTCKKRFYKHIKILLWKRKRSKKQLILQILEHFDNGQRRPQCKGYSPCKILSLGQKIKLPKTCQKRFYKHIRVVLCKKWLEETAIIRKRRRFLKWPKMATMQRV